MSKITQFAQRGARLRKSGVQAKLWPNGEISFHLPKKLRERPLSTHSKPLPYSMWRHWHLAYGIGSAVEAALQLGLSSVTNFDKNKPNPPQYGLKGITSLGRRRVRNAAYMLTRENGKHRLTFSTVTLPELTESEMCVLHERWCEVIDNYRRELSRHLKRAGLTGEVVGVTGIQEKRYAKTGFPVLHCHFVFVGRVRGGGWVVSPKRHDYIWRKSLQLVLGRPIGAVDSACQLQSVKKDCEGYLGKYMSKGASAIAGVVADGFEWALPRQWWNCSRSLVQRMRSQMRYFTDGVSWLVDRAGDADSSVWAFYSVVEVEMPDGESIAVGSYGRLTKAVNGSIRKFLDL